MPYLPAYMNVLISLGFFLSILPTFLSLMIIGTPCSYLDILVNDVTNHMEIEKEDVGKIVQDYRKFQHLAAPYLFLLYSSLSCQLITWFYSTAILLTCQHDKVNI